MGNSLWLSIYRKSGLGCLDAQSATGTLPRVISDGRFRRDIFSGNLAPWRPKMQRERFLGFLLKILLDPTVLDRI